MAQRPQARRGRRMEPVYVKRRQRGVAILVASLLLIIGSVIYIAVMRANPPSLADYSGEGNGEIELVQINEGESVSELGGELVERGIVKSNGAFQRAAGANPDAASIQPGFYRLQGEMSAEAAVAALVDPANKAEALQVPGGQTLMDVRAVSGEIRPGILSEISRISCEDAAGECIPLPELEKAAANANLEELGVPAWALEPVRARGADPKRLEGLIAPGTYVIDPKADATAVLKDLVARSTKIYNDTDIVTRAQAVGLSPYELLIAASLVEREAPAGDFDKVARVILNRLNKPMRLEFDSTVNYGLPEVEVATTDKDRSRVTPWNTYAKEGLPETPIAAPSEEALRAMENPAEGNWLFFVTVDKDGTTVFNDNFDQHQADTQRAIQNGVLDSAREEPEPPAAPEPPAPEAP
ncbi:endolytic transglycosylase MltG [Corynebacterium sp. TAE3-ERU30]|nr:endolytic transglycosylase MltG [Corynebacterium sp. TAE3-ERU30]MBV7302717.1 endolytic transglycosylase MltG [Corynebacterium sp. TAE3-ERU2]